MAAAAAAAAGDPAAAMAAGAAGGADDVSTIPWEGYFERVVTATGSCVVRLRL